MPLDLTPFRYEHPNRTKENKELFSSWVEQNKIYICFYKMKQDEYGHFDDRFYNLVEFNEDLINTTMPIHSTVDEAFARAVELDKRVIVLFSLGTTITGYDFFQTLDEYNGYSVVGHIVEKLWHVPETYYQLHPQCVIADLNDWKEHGCISFEQGIKEGELLYGIKPDKQVVYDTDPDVHLPLSIELDDSVTPWASSRNFGFGSKIISKYISNGLKLAAFNKTSRKEKKFLGSDKDAIENAINRHKKRVFAEPLDKMYDFYFLERVSNKNIAIDFENIDTIVSVALPINIIHKAMVFPHLTKFVVVDWSEQQLNFCKNVLEEWDGSNEHYADIAFRSLNRRIKYIVPFTQDACNSTLERIRKSVRYSIENIFEFTVDSPALYNISNCIGYEPTALLFNKNQRENLINTLLNDRDFILATEEYIYY